MARHWLSAETIGNTVTFWLSDQQSWVRHTLSVKSIYGQWQVEYFFNKNTHIAIVPRPLSLVSPSVPGLAASPPCEDVLRAIRFEHGIVTRVGAILTCNGATGQHYTTLFADENGERNIFDSKITDPTLLMRAQNAPGLLDKLWGVLTAPFRGLAYLLGFGRRVSSGPEAPNTVIHRTGKQPVWDRASSGYHAGGALLEIIHQSRKPGTSPDRIRSKILEGGLDIFFEDALNHCQQQQPAARDVTNYAHPAQLYFRGGNEPSDSVPQPDVVRIPSGSLI